MKDQGLYTLPELRYDYSALEPYLTEHQLKLHHTKHHAGYVNGANAILQKMDQAKEDNTDFDAKATFKELSFNIGGHVLHSYFWANMAPAGNGGGGEPTGSLASIIDREYGSFQRFKQLFTRTASSVEGSGWAVLAFCPVAMRPIIMQVEKHNVNVIPNLKILLAVDVWEHAYYLDYKNDRGSFLEAFWHIVNWKAVEKRFDRISEE